ncbi:MAG: ABC transporter ATP-binding protein [Candidatus Hadarchaeum sp.]|uniref:ABC transporter ATP-binding protein n=1 Tax=Candidatus Hadarchaeum sp. TaxID=2883567 RepID=UPI003D0FAC76
MDQTLAIETHDLTKRYNDFVAVDRLNLSIRAGELFGLLGPNGAGKTTTVLMLLGLTEPSAGTCRVFAHDPFREPLKVKSITGYLAERTGLYEDLTPEQNLRYITKLNRIPEEEARKRIQEALTSVGATGYADVKVGKLSRGMRQRVGIAGVLVKKPKVAIFDEPTQGLDPEGKNELLELMKRISKEGGTTVLLLSHMLADVQHTCDRIGIMLRGKMFALGTIEELRTMTKEDWVIDIEADDIPPKLVHDLSSLHGVKGVDRSGKVITVRSEKDIRQAIMEVFLSNRAVPISLRARERSLEEIYLGYLGER